MGRWALALAASLAASGARGEDVTRTFEAASVKRVTLESGRGQVRLRATDGRTTTVVAHKIAFDGSCLLAIALRGDTLVVINRESAKNLGRSCEVGLDLEVPRQVALSLRVGIGDVAIDGIKGDLDYRLGNGDLVVTAADLGALTGRSGSGNIRLSGAVEGADLKIGAGDADITITRAVSRGHLDMKVGTGSAVVSLPRASRVRGSFKAGLGSMTNEFQDVGGRAFTISAAAGSGDLTIKKR